MSPQKAGAPDELESVRAFVNTLDLESGVDLLAGADDLEAWMSAHGLWSGGAADEASRRRAVRVREALREVLLANNDGHQPDPAAAPTLDDAAGRARLRLVMGPGGQASLESEAAGVDGALGRLLVSVYRAMENGTWARLKACRNDRCRWAFYDHSKNHSGHWCDMAVCGNRSKVEAYRRRRSSAAR